MRSLQAKDRAKGGGLDPVESQILEQVVKDIDEKVKVNREGTYLDYVDDNNVPMPDEYNAMTRGQQVDYLENQYGIHRENADGEIELISRANVNFFKDSEIKDMIETYNNGTFAEQASVPKMVNDMVGDSPHHRDKAYQQIARKDVELGVIGSLLGTPEDRSVGMAALEGKEFLKGTGSDFINKPSDTKANIFSVVSEVLPYETTKTAQAYSNVVMYLYANELMKEGKPATSALTRSEARRIFERVIGGETWRMPSGAQAVPLGRGFSASDSRDFWNAMNDEALVKMGGGKLPIDNRNSEYEGTEVTWERIHDEGILQPTGVGDTYYVLMPPAPGQGLDNIPLMNASTGKRFIFDGEMMPEPVIRSDSPLIESMP